MNLYTTHPSHYYTKINIPLVTNLKIDNVLKKDFSIHLKKHNKVRHMFKLDYNITKINFYLYLYNNEI